MSKCLGLLSNWEAKLRVAKESGYNLIHFTPIQELAASRSGYSLKDQLKIDHTYGDVTYEDVGRVISKMRDEWNIASICDIVLNHTGNESPWLKDHPEATYSTYTSPHLRPAFLLDALLAKVNDDVSKGSFELLGCPIVVDSESHIQALRHQIMTQYLPKIKLHEFYQVDVEKYFHIFVDAIRSRTPPSPQTEICSIELTFEQDKEYRRKAVTIDIELALKLYNVFRNDCFDEDTRIRKCSETFRNTLENYNSKLKTEIESHLDHAVDNALCGVRYERIQTDGPSYRIINAHTPLFTPYFTRNGTKGKSLEEIEEMMYGESGKLFMAHNGWVK